MTDLAVWMGYLASLLLAISLIVTNEMRFRWINMFGCVAFIVYGLLIGAFPVLLTNIILFLINLYRLIRNYQTIEAFDVYEFNPDDKIVAKFLAFYGKDIETYFPAFTPDTTQHQLRFMVLRDMNIANIFTATLDADGTAHVQVNYTIPKYRDFKVGTYLFKRNPSFLISKGVLKVQYDSVTNKSHLSFLRKMDFVPQGNGMVKHFIQ